MGRVGEESVNVYAGLVKISQDKFRVKVRVKEVPQ